MAKNIQLIFDNICLIHYIKIFYTNLYKDVVAIVQLLLTIDYQ